MRTINWLKQLTIYHTKRSVKLETTVFQMTFRSSGISDSSRHMDQQHNTVKDATLTAMGSVVVWKIVDSLVKQQLADIGLYAVLILNRPINIPEHLMSDLWNGACFRATADGGTDRWYDFVSKIKEKSILTHFHPNLVSGDFDSICHETLQYCKENGVNIVETRDQDKSDFNKALEEIIKQSKDSINCIIAVVENSGRLEHIMSNLNVLYTEVTALRPLYLLASDSITWLLKSGCHKICVPQELVQIQGTCGLIPLGNPCVVTTTGLKWNLNNTKMAFGGLISSSNTYDSTCQGVVTVKTDSSLLFTVNLGFIEN